MKTIAYRILEWCEWPVKVVSAIKQSLSRGKMMNNQIWPENPIDVASIRALAKEVDQGSVTPGYRADQQKVIKLLNDALATELVCVLRYKRHFYTASGLQNSAVKEEFWEHANQEQIHANQLAERIVQLNGSPDFNPVSLASRSHAEYDESTSVHEMIRSDLIAERVAIESYRQMIELIGDTDPTTKYLLIGIMATEEKHADDLRELL